ncbi:MAG: antirestriction protein ArdA [Pseudomonadota bacterium]
MPKLHAQPYDISASGFYFDDAEEYAAKAKTCRNDFGGVVEELEIQFIDGEDIDCQLAKAWGLYQSSFAAYLNAAEDWDEHDKRVFIVAVGECGYAFDPAHDHPDEFDVDLYEVDSLKDVAEQFVDEGLFGDIPERLRFYIDHEAIARDLACDYAMIEIAGIRYAYRCG